ncbi:MAG: potassium transporter [Bacteroidetes bacterium]|nr:potassium transporter [Bacteroidota bacterium]
MVIINTNKMKYIIIGLGNYGRILAEELSVLGHEVIGADISESRVDIIKDKIATAFVIDATDEISLSVLPLNSVDVVIVAIGENFGASVRVVALLKQRQVKYIYARAIDAVHKAVLEAFGLEKILTPEEESARSLVQLLDFGTKIESFRVDEDYYVMIFRVPEKFVGYLANELNLDQEFCLKVLALKRAEKVNNFLGISMLESSVVNKLPQDDKIQPDDELVCYGRYHDFQAFWKAL